MRLIDADALIAEWRKELNITEEDRGAVFVGYTQIPAMINKMPTIEERKKGKWEEHHVSAYNNIGVYIVRAKCSVCGRYSWQSTVDDKEIGYNFCPRCGADMRGEDDGGRES